MKFRYRVAQSVTLAENYFGPFEIITQADTYSFTLQLPNSMCFIQLVFHVSMLEPSTPNMFSSCELTLDPPVILDGEPEYKISENLDSKINKCHKCRLQCLVYL